MSILALDLSLTATGWARSDGTSGVLKPTGEFARGIDRLRWIRWAVLRLIPEESGPAAEHVAQAPPVQLVVLEGYAFAAVQQAHHLGELGGVIRCALADANIPFLEIPPASAKLFATGKGNAKKEDMLAAAIRKLKYGGNDHNEADALWLLDMAWAHYTQRALSATEQRAMAKAVWPAIAYPPLRTAPGAAAAVDRSAPTTTRTEDAQCPVSISTT